VNYFELFHLPPQFELDNTTLADTYRQLQQQHHPDRVAAAPEGERLLAMQQASDINAAYQTLKDPLARAEYLLMVQGLDIRGEQQTLQDTEFLIQQLTWREELEELRDAADPEAGIPVFEQRIRSEYNQLMLALQQALQAEQLAPAADVIRKLKFVRKLREELSRLEDSLMDL
jgi:molecular chaperone HscB